MGDTANRSVVYRSLPKSQKEVPVSLLVFVSAQGQVKDLAQGFQLVWKFFCIFHTSAHISRSIFGRPDQQIIDGIDVVHQGTGREARLFCNRPNRGAANPLLLDRTISS